MSVEERDRNSSPQIGKQSVECDKKANSCSRVITTPIAFLLGMIESPVSNHPKSGRCLNHAMRNKLILVICSRHASDNNSEHMRLSHEADTTDRTYSMLNHWAGSFCLIIGQQIVGLHEGVTIPMLTPLCIVGQPVFVLFQHDDATTVCVPYGQNEANRDAFPHLSHEIQHHQLSFSLIGRRSDRRASCTQLAGLVVNGKSNKKPHMLCFASLCSAL